VQIQVLGPLRAWRAGVEVDLGPPGQRAVLGLLALAGGQPVPIAELVDALWQEQPPSTAVNVLQTHVSRLRRLLEVGRQPHGRSVLLPLASGGYALRLPAQQVDLTRFRQLVGRAERSRTAGDLAASADLLGQALRLWRGGPLAGIAVLARHPRLVALARERSAALARYAETMIIAGAAADALPVLSEAAAAQPLDEAAQARLIRGYHAAGQRAAAFEHYHETRRCLADALGVDPGPELRDAHTALLNGHAPAKGLPTAEVITAVSGTAGVDEPGSDQPDSAAGLPTVDSIDGLAAALRQLRRRHGRQRGAAPLTYRELAAQTGWALSVIGEYFGGKALPSTDRLDGLARLLGASPAEQGALATARDRVEERRRRRGAESPAPAGGRTGPPEQLPLDVRGFAGRAAELALLDAASERSGREPTAGGFIVVSGTAGVGKTALAVRWAHQQAHRFPDGHLFANLGGYDRSRPVPPAEVLASFLRALGVPWSDIPVEVEERAVRFRTLMSRRRMLVLLDNAGSAEQVRPLLPGSPACLVLVTSRDALSGLVALHGAVRVELDLLPLADAVGLLSGLIGQRAGAGPALLTVLARHCARLPLALRVAAELANAQAGTPLEQLIDELVDQRRLDMLTGGDDHSDVRAVFSWSYRALASAAARAFRLLSLHPGLDYDAYATAAALDAPLPQARAWLGALVRAHLVHRVGADRYGMHDLLRAYAAGLTAAGDEEPDRLAAVRRLVDYYLAAATAAMDLAHPAGRDRRPRVAPSGLATPTFTTSGAALAWLDAERSNLVSIVELAARQGLSGQVADLGRTLYRYLDTAGHHREAVAVHRCAHDAASRAGDVAGQAHALTGLGAADFRLGRYASADDSYQQALSLYRSAGDRAGEAHALLTLSAIAGRRGSYRVAAEYLQRARIAYRAINDPIGEARGLSNLGLVYEHTGRHALAVEHHREALALLRHTPDRVGEAHALTNLANALARTSSYAQSADHYRRALALFREIGDRRGETDALNGLGETLSPAGQHDEAGRRHAAALALAVRTGDRYEVARAHRGLGRSEQAAGRPDQARQHWQRALTLFTELGVPETADLRAQLAAAGSGRRGG
jgi:DNA-binding SARP family transcriptional activator